MAAHCRPKNYYSTTFHVVTARLSAPSPFPPLRAAPSSPDKLVLVTLDRRIKVGRGLTTHVWLMLHTRLAGAFLV